MTLSNNWYLYTVSDLKRITAQFPVLSETIEPPKNVPHFVVLHITTSFFHFKATEP